MGSDKYVRPVIAAHSQITVTYQTSSKQLTLIERSVVDVFTHLKLWVAVYRDPQLQVSKTMEIVGKRTYMYNLRQNMCKSRKCNAYFAFKMYSLKEKKNENCYQVIDVIRTWRHSPHIDAAQVNPPLSNFWGQNDMKPGFIPLHGRANVKMTLSRREESLWYWSSQGGVKNHLCDPGLSMRVGLLNEIPVVNHPGSRDQWPNAGLIHYKIDAQWLNHSTIL